jgi:nitrogen fixation-related uncharacterized protein
MSRRWLVAVLLIPLIIGEALGSGVPPCNCNNGNVDISEPQCLCACFEGYLLPHCLYTATDMVPMDVWLLIPPKDFLSSAFLQSLQWGLQISSPTDVVFLYAYPSPLLNRTDAFVSIVGSKAQQLLWDYYSNNSWLSAASIESVWEDVPPSSPLYIVDQRFVIYSSSDGNVIITVQTLAWLIGAVVLALAMGLVEFWWVQFDDAAVVKAIVDERRTFHSVAEARSAATIKILPVKLGLARCLRATG